MSENPKMSKMGYVGQVMQFLNKPCCLFTCFAEALLKPYQKSTMEFLAKIVESPKPLTIFPKHFITDLVSI